MTAASPLRVVVGGSAASMNKTTQSGFARRKSSPLWWLAPPPLPRWEACHWILSRLPTPYSTAITDSLDSQVAGVTPVPLPPLFRGALWMLGIVPHVPIGKHRAVYSSLNRSGVMASSHSPVNLKNFPQQKSRPAGQLFIHVIILRPELLRGKELLPKRRRFFCGLHRC